MQRLILIFLLAGCTSVGSPPKLETDKRYETQSGEQAALQSNERAVVEDVVRAKMDTPDSVRFGFMNATQGDGGIVKVCGWVNGKNFLGRWLGYRPFYATYLPVSEKAVLNGLATSTDGTRLVKAQCRDAGVSLSEQPGSV